MSGTITLSVYVTETDSGNFMVFNQNDAQNKRLRKSSFFNSKYNIIINSSQLAEVNNDIKLPDTEISAVEVARLLQAFRDKGCSVVGVN